MSQQQQIRRLVMTGAVAAVTVTGAWYGAGLKTRQEFKQVSYYCLILLSTLPLPGLLALPILILYNSARSTGLLTTWCVTGEESRPRSVP